MATLHLHRPRDQRSAACSPSSGRSTSTGHNIANANTVGLHAAGGRAQASPAYTMPGVSTAPAGRPDRHRRRRRRLPAHPRRASSTSSTARRRCCRAQAAGAAGRPRSRSSSRSTSPPTTASTRCSASTGRRGRTSRTPREHGDAPGARPGRGAASPTASSSLLVAADDDPVADGPERRPTRSTQVNTIGTQIAQLNDGDLEAEAAGDTPNDLLDQRDVLIDQLSALGNVAVTTTARDGAVDVTLRRRRARHRRRRRRPLRRVAT